MTIILSNDLLTVQLPQSRIMITARRNQIRTIRTERAIPDPALMAGERALELERLRFGGCLAGGWDHGFEVFDFPDLGGVVSAAGCEVLDVRREQDAGYVFVVCLEVGYGNELSLFAVLEEVPDVDTSGVSACAQRRAVSCNGNTCDWYVLLGNQLVGAIVLS